MDENNSIQLFEDRKIRTAWDEEKEEWYFSVVDVIAVLTDQPTARNASTYWAVLKKRLKEEGASELLTNCKQLKMRATDGKMRLTDVASTEQLLRIIQSIPSPKAEPFKRWLAQVGRERIEETIDPEQAIDRALETYQKKGYDADWIHQRILSIRVRNELTAEWQARGVEQGREYAIQQPLATKEPYGCGMPLAGTQSIPALFKSWLDGKSLAELCGAALHIPGECARLWPKPSRPPGAVFLWHCG